MPSQNQNSQPAIPNDNLVDGSASAAADELLEEVYGDLRRLAQEMMSSENPGQTLQATALVHEAFLRLNRGDHRFNDRGHFFVVAARAMRRILIDNARSRASNQRIRDRLRFKITPAEGDHDEKIIDLLTLDGALQRLAINNDRVAQIVNLRYFAGLNQSETAEALGISASTVKRDWAFARAWLYRAFSNGESEPFD